MECSETNITKDMNDLGGKNCKTLVKEMEEEK